MADIWETFDGELPNGREIKVFYNHQTKLTVIPDYVRGRTLIFNDEFLNDEELNPNTIISCYVPNTALDKYTPEEVFEMAQLFETNN